MEDVKAILKRYEPIISRRMEKGKWYWTDKIIIQQLVPKIGFAAKVVYDYLASMVDATQTCYPSQGYIAKALGCSRSTVNRAIKQLERNGLIYVDKSARYPQLYRLLRIGSSTGKTEVSHQ